LIQSALLTANGDEIDRAEAYFEMRGMIQPFPHDTHPAIIPMVANPW
jgi:hypothetical protein